MASDRYGTGGMAELARRIAAEITHQITAGYFLPVRSIVGLSRCRMVTAKLAPHASLSPA